MLLGRNIYDLCPSFLKFSCCVVTEKKQWPKARKIKIREKIMNPTEIKIRLSRLFVLLFLNISCIVFGAYLFFYIEGSQETSSKCGKLLNRFKI